MSSKRDRRSRSRSKSSTKSKRTLDLVSTRRYSPPSHYVPRPFRGGSSRGRPPRRAFYHRGSHGLTIYRGMSQRYYPRHDRYNSRDDSRSRHRRSRSRNKSHSRERSRSRSYERSKGRRESREHRHRSRSDSSSSESESHRHRHSRTSERRRSSAKDEHEERQHARASYSSEERAPVKKKPRHRDSASREKNSPQRSDSQERHQTFNYDHQRHKMKYEEDKSKVYTDRHPSKSEPEERERAGRYKKKSPSLSPEVQHRHKKAAPASKKKELIPRNRLHQIFSLISQDADFELDEDISIAIQRNPYAEPSEDSTVTVVFDEKLFGMIYPYEGRKHKAIFDREEIKMFGHDKNLADDPDYERRVIRVKPGKSSQHNDQSSSRSHNQYRGSSLEITRTVKRNQSRSRSRSRSASPPMHRNPQFRLRVSTDPKFEARFAELQKKEGGSSRRSGLDPSDLRHELTASRKTSDSRGHSDQSLDRHGNVRKFLEKRSSREESKKDEEDLPDFSRRKEKYQLTPWLDQPELIPKDPKYFMHDDRERMDQHDRGRGRGRFFRGRGSYRRPLRPFRSRGSFRGPYRGRGDYYNSQSRSPRRPYSSRDTSQHLDREWKHDKFSELETEGGERKSHREDDQHPHSTTER